MSGSKRSRSSDGDASPQGKKKKTVEDVDEVDDRPPFVAPTKYRANGNNILRIAALEGYSECIQWARNNLEAALDAVPLFNEYLDNRRRMWPFSYSLDTSTYFPNEFIICKLLMLQSEDENSSDDHILREKFGCTCGQCLKGFMSPKMKFTLLAHAEIQYDMCHDEMRTGGMLYDVYISAVLRSKMDLDESWRLGYVEIFTWVKQCLQEHKVPTEEEILHMLNENTTKVYSRAESKDSAATALKFLEAGGKVADVMRVIFGITQEQDEETGDGFFTETFEEDLDLFLECRNDRELGFVAAMCGVQKMGAMRYSPSV